MGTGTKIIVVTVGLAGVGLAAYFLLKKKPAATTPATEDVPGANATDNPGQSAVLPAPSTSTPKGSSLINETPAQQWPSTPALNQGTTYEDGFPLKVGSKNVHVMKLNLKLGGVKNAQPVPAGISYAQNPGSITSTSFSTLSPSFTEETERRLYAKYGITQINSSSQLSNLGK